MMRLAEKTGRGLPEFSDDPVTDYLVAEAVMVKASEQEKEAQKKQKREEWRQGHREMGK